MNAEDIATRKVRIGWIGAGVMGAPMAGRLIDAGYDLTIYNRTMSKAEPLFAKGAARAESPQEVIRQAGIVFTLVGFPADVEEVYFSEKGIISGLSPDKALVDMTTTKPALALKIYRAAKEHGAHAIDAPVSGGDVGARTGSLSVMTGGDRETLDLIMPLLEILGKNIVYHGKAGSGQHAKMCNQIIISGTMIGVCESMLYAYRAGLDPDTILTSVARGAAGCWTLDNLAPRIIKRDFEPGFYVDHFVKDMEIALDEARRMNLSLPGLALVHQLYCALKAQGHGDRGTHALMLALEKLSAINPEKS